MESMAATTQRPTFVLRARNLDRAGFAHGFSLRGDTQQAAARGENALDFGAAAGAEARAESVLRLARVVGFAACDLRQVDQVHGARVVMASAIAEARGT